MRDELETLRAEVKASKDSAAALESQLQETKGSEGKLSGEIGDLKKRIESEKEELVAGHKKQLEASETEIGTMRGELETLRAEVKASKDLSLIHI